MKDYYAIVGVPKTATSAEIKKAYKKAAVKLHPDRNDSPDALTKFQEFQEAYNILSDETLRRRYDASLVSAQNPFHSSNYRPYQHKTYEVKINLEAAYSGVSATIAGHNVWIPPGVRTGNKLSVNNLFFVQVIVVPHSKFKRSNDDLLVDISVTATEAMTGVDVCLTTIDEKQLKFTVPKGTQPGQVIRLANKGMPNPELSVAGDMLIRCNIYIDGNLTDEQLQAILKFNNRKVINI